MSKIPYSEQQVPVLSARPKPQAVDRRCRPVLVTAFCLCLSLWALAVRYPGYGVSPFAKWSSPGVLEESPEPGHVSEGSFRWRDIIPSNSLEYTPCYTSFLCARLSVPYNWNATALEQEHGPRAAIAVIKLPAKVPVTDARYGGPVVLNPGGPGESGVYQVLSDGKHVQTIVDAPEAPEEGDATAASSGKYFDILSFDPRGVNNTTPSLHCFPDAFNQQVWRLEYLDYGLLWDSPSVAGMELARAGALGASCSRREDNGILPYANTAQVVGDMVAIIEGEGAWRAAEAERLLSGAPGGEEAKRQALKRTAYHPGDEKLQYWGMSYGTLIGSTFSAMHSGRVGRVVIDGVVDPADHYAGGYLTQLHDSDKIISKFCEYCFEAGPAKCPLYTGSSPQHIEARFTAIMLELKTSPIPVDFRTSSDLPAGLSIPGPELLTYGDVHLYLLSGMYFTFAMAEGFFAILRDVEARNMTSRRLAGIAAQKQALLSPPPVDCDINDDDAAPSATHCVPYVSGLGAFQAISCMDAGGAGDLTLPAFEAYIDQLRAQGRWISPSWARSKLVCQGFAARPAWRGPAGWDFVTRRWANTSHPLLVVGNAHDTVTPLRNARRVAADLFPGSVVLTQDAEGHCSHANPSLCTARRIRAYFQTGALPEPGTVCEPEIRPFLGCQRADGCRFEGDAPTAKLWEALVELADPFGLRKMSVLGAEGEAEGEAHEVSEELGRWDVSGYLVRPVR